MNTRSCSTASITKAELPATEKWKEALLYSRANLFLEKQRRGKAFYAVNQNEFLCTFLYHGEVEASNNQVENAQRGVVVDRKNWLFCDTPKGAEASVIAYSILETAKANGLNPEKYLTHIFTVLPDRFAKNPNADIEDLLPWNDKIMELCKLGV